MFTKDEYMHRCILLVYTLFTDITVIDVCVGALGLVGMY